MTCESIKLYYEKLNALILKVSEEDHTPILFDSYNTNDYYYILNNNKNYIYSTSEVYKFLALGKKDPFTRLPITSYKFVKVLISK